MIIAIIIIWISYQAIGAYVTYSAYKNGYLRMMATWEWMFAVTSWPWILLHVRKVNKGRDLLRPFEDYMERYEQEEIDKRLDGLD